MWNWDCVKVAWSRVRYDCNATMLWHPATLCKLSYDCGIWLWTLDGVGALDYQRLWPGIFVISGFSFLVPFVGVGVGCFEILYRENGQWAVGLFFLSCLGAEEIDRLDLLANFALQPAFGEYNVRRLAQVLIEQLIWNFPHVQIFRARFDLES